jgi:7,8-dihydropterin-6-yl-methyl-4-(beta-D-ribofuranosyl)aminobenzene 5'-phosphate synthase
MMAIRLNEIDRVEILTLQDNYIDMTATDNSAMIYRAGTRVAGEIRKPILAEHGFSALIRTTAGGRKRTMVFDFGFSEIGAAFNTKALIPSSKVKLAEMAKIIIIMQYSLDTICVKWYESC